jgi:hypothetical protein
LSIIDAIVYCADLIEALRRNRDIPILLMPAEPGNIEAVAEHHTSLDRGGRTGQAATPWGHGETTISQESADVRHMPPSNSLYQVVVRETVYLNEDKPPVIVRGKARSAQLPGHGAVLATVVEVGELPDKVKDATSKPGSHRRAIILASARR